ncbi:UDP-N-acetylmuramate--L-alanine ligase [Demequina sp.]|uniref:UDP-N-acetylmuramate--L-alanine ligase n=1 Tax=Demequina sp. TaxID=2050685 RepID=UPI003D1522D4
MRWHFIGVGGSGMSAVARLVAAKGVDVTGSDRGESAYFLALKDSGMDVRVGHDPAVVDGADAVVVSTAIRETNPELARARELGIRVVHRSEALVWALEGLRLVAVAGSHGKTTTSAMTACALHGGGVDASFAVGARVFGVEGAVAGGYAGTSDVGVVEADESDGSFLRYAPHVGIVTSIEPDHLDHYGTVEALHESFADFALSCEVLIAHGGDPVVMGIARRAAQAGVRVFTYGARDGFDAVVTPDAVSGFGATHPLAVPVPGQHNRLNAAAAWAAAVEMGADPSRAAAALGSFGGTGRRFQLRGEAGGVRVIDDYAHHPTEVAAVVSAARDAGAGHLVILFQPALFTRTRDHFQNFAAALSVDNADVVLAPVHGDREDPIEGVNSELIAQHIVGSVTVAESLEDAARIAASLARPGSTVLTVGSGTVTKSPDWILAELGAQ